MKKNTEVKPTTLSVAYTLDKGAIDPSAFARNAEKAARDYNERTQKEQAAVASSVSSIVAEWKDTKKFTAAGLASLALTAMKEMPDASRVAEVALTVKQLLSSNEDFLHVEAGRNSGFYVIDRHTAEELKALTTTTEE